MDIGYDSTWKEEFLHKAAIDHPAGFPFILIGNKIDVENKRQVNIRLDPILSYPIYPTLQIARR